jgi:hypothetical protein
MANPYVYADRLGDMVSVGGLTVWGTLMLIMFVRWLYRASRREGGLDR